MYKVVFTYTDPDTGIITRFRPVFRGTCEECCIYYSRLGFTEGHSVERAS